MLIVSPVHADERLNLHTHNFCDVMKALGTSGYAQSCLSLFRNH